MRLMLLIVIDCLRADHVSAYGYGRETTPTIDRLASRGVLWEQAFSTSSWTKPSVTSLLTGLYPTQHGAFVGIKRDRAQGRVTTDVLRSATPTLAEALSRAGWRCAAFINNAQLGTFTNLNRGFEVYRTGAGRADRIIESLKDWWSSDADRPAFAYLHFLEAHWPYKPRRRHVRAFGGDRDTNRYRDFRARDYARLRRAVSRREKTLSEEELADMIMMYDGAVRRLDGKIKSILSWLKDVGLEDETTLIVTADHGEEFLEHGKLGHGQSVHVELTHVPLVMTGPDVPAGRRMAAPVSLADVPRTLLSRVADPSDLPGADLLDGDRPRPAFSEQRIRLRYMHSLRDARWSYLRTFRFDIEGDVLDDRRTAWEWVRDLPHERRERLFDRQADPRERHDLAGEAAYASVRDEREAVLDDWWAGIARETVTVPEEDVVLDPRVVQHLRDLGYLE